MFSGVLKSGSPKRKVENLDPSAFSRFAAPAIASVAEGQSHSPVRPVSETLRQFS